MLIIKYLIEARVNVPELMMLIVKINVVRCAIWYHWNNLKNVKDTRGGVLILDTPPWMFFTFFKMCKWYQVAQRITNGHV